MVSLTATPLKVGPSPGTYDDAPALSDLGDQACTERPEGANPRLLAWLPGSDSCSSSGAVSRPPPTTPPPAPEEEEEKAISVRKGLGDFLRVGRLHRRAKSLTGIQGTRRDAACRAAQWLKSSVERLSEKSRRHPKRGRHKAPNRPVWPVLTPIDGPYSRLERHSHPFSDSLSTHSGE
jgi:hypothetical protein